MSQQHSLRPDLVFASTSPIVFARILMMRKAVRTKARERNLKERNQIEFWREKLERWMMYDALRKLTSFIFFSLSHYFHFFPSQMPVVFIKMRANILRGKVHVQALSRFTEYQIIVRREIGKPNYWEAPHLLETSLPKPIIPYN